MYTSVQELVNAINNQTTYKVQLTSQFKDGRIREALKVSGEETWLSPIIYDPEFMLEYNMQEVVDFINKCYKDAGIDRQELVKFFENKDLLLDKVYPEVVNHDKYLSHIEDRNLVTTDYLDLSELYYISLGEGMRVKIKNEHIEELGITPSELRDCARANNYGEVKLKTMNEIIREMMGVIENESDIPIVDDVMWVLTRKDNMFGASYIADYQVLSYCAEKLGSNKLIILPSSRHELILVKYSTINDAEELYNIVSSVNRTEVKEEDFLSNNVYVFDNVAYTLDYLKY